MDDCVSHGWLTITILVTSIPSAMLSPTGMMAVARLKELWTQ